MAKKYFGTDGIRGAINSKNINGDMFFKFGLASGTYFKSQKKRKQIAIIAKDTRLSGYTLEPALVSGLTSAGGWNACLHTWTFAYKWFGDVDKSNESQHGYNDYSLS